MSFGDILGQLMNSGLGGQTQNRVNTSVNNLGAAGGAGGGLEAILGQLQGALGGAAGGGAAGGGAAGGGGAVGGFADKARDFMTKDQVGGMSGAQLGGIGAMAGALLGGGVGGAARGGALAVLGTLALGALKTAQAKAQAGQPGTGQPLSAEPHEIAAVTGPEAEKLMVRAMISAAKADGQIDQAEMQKIIGKVGAEGVTPEEKAFVMAELGAPVDIDALAADVAGPAQAAEVYAASLIAIDLDSEAEKDYLRRLARALGLDAATVAHLHQMTGAPAV